VLFGNEVIEVKKLSGVGNEVPEVKIEVQLEIKCLK
jgi:hypothetical protein